MNESQLQAVSEYEKALETFKLALEDYEVASIELGRFSGKPLKKLRNYQRKVRVERVKSVLLIRDHLEEQLEQIRNQNDSIAAYYPDQDQTKALDNLEWRLNSLDRKLKNQRATIVEVLETDQELKQFQPRDAGEWWFYTAPLGCWNRLDLLWNSLTFFLIVGSLGLATSLIPLFFAGGSGTLGALGGALSAIAPTLLAVLSLDKLNQARTSLEQNLEKIGLPKQYWQEVIFVFSLICFGILASAFLLKPKIASFFFNHANVTEIGNTSKGLASADANLKVATAFNPDYSEAHFWLGYIYELRQDSDKARDEYKLAMQGQIIQPKDPNQWNTPNYWDTVLLARVRLAKSILVEDIFKTAEAKTEDKAKTTDSKSQLERAPNNAASILLQGSEDAKNTLDKETRKSWYTVLGWARLRQERYPEAAKELQKAIGLLYELGQNQGVTKPIGYTAYCIQAELREKQGQKDANDWWSLCSSKVVPEDIDDDIWYGKAQQRISK